MADARIGEDRNHMLDSIDNVLDVFGIDNADYFDAFAQWLLDMARSETNSEVYRLLHDAAYSLQSAAGAYTEAQIVSEFSERENRFVDEWLENQG